jgi:Domain of unknown function (DUF4189)
MKEVEMPFGKIPPLIAVGMVACSWPSLRAQECVNRCMIAYQCNTSSTISCSEQQSHARELCEIGCKGNDAPLLAAPYGAVAFGDEGAEGMSWNQTSASEAQRLALSNCGRHGKNCKLMSGFENTCGAIAKSDDQRHAEMATAPTKEQAATNALAACRSRWGGKCTSDLSGCSYADRHVPPPGPRAVSWGAIAFSAVDGQTGHSMAKDDRASAEKEALADCSRRGKTCAVMIAFDKQCGALVRDGKIGAVATAVDQQTALRQATQACAKDGGTRCVPLVLFCSK